jgi:CTP synthase (UTP-ammonia lyase)
MKPIYLLGDYDATKENHVMTGASIDHVCARHDLHVPFEWISPIHMEEDVLVHCSGLWIAPGSPFEHWRRVVAAIRFARENKIPCIGTCAGFQCIILEFAQNRLNVANATSEEFEPHASELFITRLSCSLAGKEMDIRLLPDTSAHALYKSQTASEKYYCSFGLNPDKKTLLEGTELLVSGVEANGEIRIVEIQDHPFFMGTLFVPQTSSTSQRPHPLVEGFVKVCVDTHRGD